MKGGFCVSTVSIVCGRARGSMAFVAGRTYWTGRRLARPRVVIVIADDADLADGKLRSDSARRSYRSMAVSCRSERTVAMHLNVHDEIEPRIDKTPVLTSRWLLVQYDQMATLLMFRT